MSRPQLGVREKRRIRPEAVPPIRIFERDGKFFTLDNRRLWSFREARILIPYRMATGQEIAEEAWKLTTKNEGRSVHVKGRP